MMGGRMRKLAVFALVLIGLGSGIAFASHDPVRYVSGSSGGVSMSHSAVSWYTGVEYGFYEWLNWSNPGGGWLTIASISESSGWDNELWGQGDAYWYSYVIVDNFGHTQFYYTGLCDPIESGESFSPYKSVQWATDYYPYKVRSVTTGQGNCGGDQPAGNTTFVLVPN